MTVQTAHGKIQGGHKLSTAHLVGAAWLRLAIGWRNSSNVMQTAAPAQCKCTNKQGILVKIMGDTRRQ